MKNVILNMTLLSKRLYSLVSVLLLATCTATFAYDDYRMLVLYTQDVLHRFNGDPEQVEARIDQFEAHAEMALSNSEIYDFDLDIVDSIMIDYDEIDRDNLVRHIIPSSSYNTDQGKIYPVQYERGPLKSYEYIEIDRPLVPVYFENAVSSFSESSRTFQFRYSLEGDYVVPAVVFYKKGGIVQHQRAAYFMPTDGEWQQLEHSVDIEEGITDIEIVINNYDGEALKLNTIDFYSSALAAVEAESYTGSTASFPTRSHDGVDYVELVEPFETISWAGKVHNHRQINISRHLNFHYALNGSAVEGVVRLRYADHDLVEKSVVFEPTGSGAHDWDEISIPFIYQSGALTIELEIYTHQGDFVKLDKMEIMGSKDWVTINSLKYATDYGVDLVYMIVNQVDGIGGHAIVGGGFATGRLGADTVAKANHTFVHELGHTLGILHNRHENGYQGDFTRTGTSDYIGFGYNFVEKMLNEGRSHEEINMVPNGQRWGTLMSYTNNYVNYFSGPGLADNENFPWIALGVPEGTLGASGTELDGEFIAADASQAIRDNKQANRIKRALVSATDTTKVSDLSAKAGDAHFYKFRVPPFCRVTEISLSGGTGDADLLVSKGKTPEPGRLIADYMSRSGSNNESVTVSEDYYGDRYYYICIQAYGDYSGVNLTATYEPVSEYSRGSVDGFESGDQTSEHSGWNGEWDQNGLVKTVRYENEKILRLSQGGSINRELEKPISNGELHFRWDLDSPDGSTEVIAEVYVGYWREVWYINSSHVHGDDTSRPDNMQKTVLDIDVLSVTALRFRVSNTTGADEFFYVDEIMFVQDVNPAVDYDAEFLSVTGVPDLVKPFKVFNVAATVRNTGNITWMANDDVYMEVYSSDPIGGLGVVEGTFKPDRNVPPGSTYRFNIGFRAYYEANINFRLGMMYDQLAGSYWFGDQSQTLTVASSKITPLFSAGTVVNSNEPMFPTDDLKLILQGDGNMVLYNHDSGTGTTGTPIWSSNSVAGPGNYFAILQGDGNFLIRNADTGELIYKTNSQDGPGNYFMGIENDVLSIIKGDGPGDPNKKQVWANIRDHLKRGEKLQPGEIIREHNGWSFTVLQSGGNLVTYEGSGVGDIEGVIWASGSNVGVDRCFLNMQGDGNIVIYSGTMTDVGFPIWSLNSGAGSGDYYIRNDDASGKLEVYMGTDPY